MLLVCVFFLFGHLLAAHGEDTPFKCVNTDDDCPSKMCFYSIDHEERCYRAGCADTELCHGRRNNECFMTNSVHTCCCLEAGCAAGYKGLNDCVDEPKNSTEAVTSVTDVTTTRLASADISTVAPTTPKEQTSPTTAKPPSASMEGTSTASTKKVAEASTEKQMAATAETTASEAASTRTTATTTSSQTAPSSEVRRAPVATTSISTTEKQDPTTARTTVRAIHPLRPLPDLSHSENKVVTNGREPIELTTTTTRSAKTHPKMRVESFAEPRAAESESIFSPAMRDEQQPKTRKSSGESSKKASGDEKKATSSLISVYEVTTQAVKNRESQEEWKAPVPWWSAVILGFLVAVITAWVVVFIIRKKRARETETPNRATEKEQGLVDPLLRASEENSRHSDNSRI
ncbi:hypothetical protein OSTOST_00626 [Ostertagia ostertagi]